jgi:hypothetical protein
MSRNEQHKSPDFSALVRRLVRLHELIAQGKGDAPDADALRDEMDAPWRRLTPAETELLDDLSVDLYSLGLSKPETASTPTTTGIPADFVDFVRCGEWHQVLRLLRDHQACFPPADLAWIRGVCWAHLRYPEVALQFFHEKARLQSLKPEEEIWLLTCMMQAKRSADLIPRVEQIARSESDPLLLLKAAEVFSTRASELTGDEADALRRAAITTAQRGLQQAKTRTGDELLSVLLVGANLRLAFDCEALGEVGEALNYCDEALRMDPTNANAMMLRAWLNRDRNPEAAAGEFRRGLSSGLTATFGDMPLIPLSTFASTF